MGSARQSLVWLSTVVAVACAGAPPDRVATLAPVELPPSASAEDVDAVLAAHCKSGASVGISATIVHGGKLLVSSGYGRRSLEEHAPVDERTLFAIGSITKQFTCACILLLAEDGALTVEDPVSNWYPQLTRADDVRLLDLMQHTSGYPDYYPLDFVDRRMAEPIEPDALLAQYAGGPLDFEPRTSWSYSNTGYILLGRVVERVTDEPFGTFLRRRILDPLQMQDTAYEPDLGDPRLAKGYNTFALGPPEPSQPEAAGWIGAAGGIWSTSSDLTRWNHAVASAQLLSVDSWRTMRLECLLLDGRRTGYGCGLSVPIRFGRQVLQHGGAVDGFSAFNAVVPSTGTSIAILSNQSDGLRALADGIMEMLLTPPESVPLVAGPPAAEDARAMFVALQRGELDRARLTDDYSQFLTAGRAAGAAERLKSRGEPTSVELERMRERGRMEVTTTRLEFRVGEPLRCLMYRRPDGKIAEFLVSR